jgi:dolichol-phosphate mannosyltransferase
VSPELSVIIPTFNEAPNIEPLLVRLWAVLDGVEWEVIFVDDDSRDGTIDKIRAEALRDPRVRALHRIWRRGLSSACIEGILSSSAPWVAVMDADLQHDEHLLPELLVAAKRASAEVAVASRYLKGGRIPEWTRARRFSSNAATWLAQMLLHSRLSDPMSGFFLMRREVFVSIAPKLSGSGFKLLLDIFASAERPLRFVELPYSFRTRKAGDSKLDSRVVLEYFQLLLEHLFPSFLPVRFVLFVAVGMVGAVGHLLLLYLMHRAAGYTFLTSQAIAAFAAMTINFFLNNRFTYRDARLRGVRQFTGLLSFYAVCSIGAVTNLYVAQSLYDRAVQWIPAGLMGGIIGAVWNFGVSSTITWPTKK